MKLYQLCEGSLSLSQPSSPWHGFEYALYALTLRPWLICCTQQTSGPQTTSQKGNHNCTFSNFSKGKGCYHDLNSQSSARKCWTSEEHVFLLVTAKPFNTIWGAVTYSISPVGKLMLSTCFFVKMFPWCLFAYALLLCVLCLRVCLFHWTISTDLVGCGENP